MKNKNKNNAGDAGTPVYQDYELIPAVIQDYKTGEVLMVAYMNRESLKRSISTKTTWFWSRSRQQYWNKGSTSGNRQLIKDIRYDCDSDTLLFLVEQIGNACHTGSRSCFFNKIDLSGDTLEKDLDRLKFFQYNPGQSGILQELYDVIEKRIKQKAKDSYTYALHKKGLKEILKKVGEEGIEVIISSEDEPKERIVYEISDLLYHLLVLMVEKRISISEVYDELAARRKKSGSKNG
jgi:phosphoribosyl-ATP pyrophosphohydrolase/phosphoribosyl-AMP cyclohydrolase